MKKKKRLLRQLRKNIGDDEQYWKTAKHLLLDKIKSSEIGCFSGWGKIIS